MSPVVSRAERLLHAAEDPVVRGIVGFGGAFAVTILLLVVNTSVLAALAASVAATVAYASWRRNELHADFRVPLPAAWNASLDAVGENGFILGEPSRYETTDGVVEAGRAKVIVERHPGDLTRVRVRVGLFATMDNKRRAGLILESVQRRLD
jgi:hypothetical protein